MAYSAHTGSFNVDTSKTAGQTQSVTGVGFQPSIVFFWWAGGHSTGDEAAGGGYSAGFGAAISSSSRWCVGGVSDDAAASSNTSSFQTNTACMRGYSAGTPTLDGSLDLSSLDADGFTLVVDDQFTIDYRVSYLALGGTDLTNVYLGIYQSPASTGNHNITGVGFQPDALIVVGTNATAAAGAAGAPETWFLGLATGSGNQGVVHASASDAAATSDTFGYGYNGECVATRIVSGSFTVREAFVSFGADGFTLNSLEAGAQHYFCFVCLKGGKYSVGELTTRTDGNDISENVGFQPAAVLFASANRALSTQDTPTANARLSIG
ncbi:MAG: hypothetical protein WC455_24785, partial [Dehalococcoidia bacterium]